MVAPMRREQDWRNVFGWANLAARLWEEDIMRMGRRLVLAILAASALAACGGPTPGADPVATVEPLYAPYLANENPKSLLESAPWTTELRGLLERAIDLSEQRNEPLSVNDFDPIVDAQDWQITDLTVELTKPPEDGRAEVVAHFKNYDEDVAVTYDLREEGGGWRVDNMSTPNWSLRQMLADLGITPET